MRPSRWIWLWIAVISIVLASGPTAAARDAAPPPVEQTVSQAVVVYGQGLDTAERDARLESFRRAERLFARAASDPRATPELLTNLGNAALQAEHLGTAVLAYRRALALDPDHPRALQNLAHARSLLPEWVPKPSEGGLLDSFFFWHRTLTRSDRALAGAAAFALAAVLLAGGIRLAQPTLRTAAILPVLVWLALVASVAVDSSSGADADAVVTADEAVARAADSALAPSALPAPLPGGVEVRVLERRSPWTRVRLANGRDAWLAESALTEVASRSGATP